MVFVDAIPLRATGKLQKNKLRDQFREYKLPTAWIHPRRAAPPARSATFPTGHPATRSALFFAQATARLFNAQRSPACA